MKGRKNTVNHTFTAYTEMEEREKKPYNSTSTAENKNPTSVA